MAHKYLRIVMAAVLAAGLALAAGQYDSSAAGPVGRPGAVPGQYIIVFKDDTADVEAKADELSKMFGLARKFTYGSALKGFAAGIPEALLNKIRANPAVAFISEDQVVKSTSLELQTGVNRIEADLSRTANINGNTTGDSLGVPAVAILDSGIDTAQTDLSVKGGKGCVPFSSSYNDGYGHGTLVAGVVGAKDNGAGVVGVAPGAPLYSVRVLNSFGSGTTSSIICGVDWVAANSALYNIKVANMSVATGGSNDNNCGNSNADALHKSVCNATAKGVTFVAAAGNDTLGFEKTIPAAYPEVLTVSYMVDFDGAGGGKAVQPATCDAGQPDDVYSWFSNFATPTYDSTGAVIMSTTVAGKTAPVPTAAGHAITAPGTCITSTRKGGGTETQSGSSMAAPHVAGAVALCLAKTSTSQGPCYGKAPAQVIAQVISDAKQHALADPTYGFAPDPTHYTPDTNPANQPGRYYGYLVYAGGY